MNKHEIIGKLTKRVIDTFKLTLSENQPILCGESNRKHMQEEHPEDYNTYGDKIEEIISNPDFIAKHPKKKNSSIEYVKIYKNEGNEYVLVAIRASGNGTLFARTLFVMDPEKVDKYNEKSALIPYKWIVFFRSVVISIIFVYN